MRGSYTLFVASIFVAACGGKEAPDPTGAGGARVLGGQGDPAKSASSSGPGFPAGSTIGSTASSTSSSGGPTTDDACTSQGGLCLPPFSTPGGPPERHPSDQALCSGDQSCWLVVGTPAIAACKTEADCSEDPSPAAVSAAVYVCFQGVCACRPGYHVQPNGKCAAKDPQDCTASSGRCVNGTQCEPGWHRTSTVTDQTCGDFQAATCCAPICKTPVDLVCCNFSDGKKSEPVCVSGWTTCETGKPDLRSNNCR